MAAVVLVLAVLTYTTLRFHKQKKNITQVKITTQNQPTLGKKDAAVKIVAFEDLKCMMCKLFNLNLYPEIKKQYIDTGKANYSVINLAFIPGSMTAAVTARCLYEQKPQYFFQFVKYLYQHQGPENEDWTTVSNMLNDASKISGVDSIRLGVCVSTGKYTDLIKNNLKYAAKVMGYPIKTPSIYINGILVEPLTIERFKEVYDMASSS